MKKLLIIAFVFISGMSYGQEGVTLNRSTTLKLEEVPPTWPGCTGSINQKNNCFRQKLVTHIIKGYKFSADHQQGARVVVKLNITTEGKPDIASIEGGSPGMQAEIRRKIMSMPEVKPGHSGGTPEVREYTIPMTF